MDLTVREHIAALQARINALVSKLVNEKGWAKRNAIESEIRGRSNGLSALSGCA